MREGDTPGILEKMPEQLPVSKLWRHRASQPWAWLRAGAGNHGICARQVSLQGVSGSIRQLDNSPRAVSQHQRLQSAQALIPEMETASDFAVYCICVEVSSEVGLGGVAAAHSTL